MKVTTQIDLDEFSVAIANAPLTAKEALPIINAAGLTRYFEGELQSAQQQKQGHEAPCLSST